MTTQMEVIDGHPYEVTRDDAGRIVRQEGRSPKPERSRTMLISPQENQRLQSRDGALLNLHSSQWTLEDIADMLKIIRKGRR